MNRTNSMNNQMKTLIHKEAMKGIRNEESDTLDLSMNTVI